MQREGQEPRGLQESCVFYMQSRRGLLRVQGQGVAVCSEPHFKGFGCHEESR